MNGKVIKHTLRNHVYAVWSLPIHLIIFIVVPQIALRGIEVEGALPLAYSISFILFSITVLPAVVIYLNYYYHDYGKEIIIENSFLILINKGVSKEYNFSDIKKTDLILSVNTFNNHIGLNTWDGLFYYRIYFNDGSQLVITCLLAQNWKPCYKKYKIKKVKKIWPLVERCET